MIKTIAIFAVILLVFTLLFKGAEAMNQRPSDALPSLTVTTLQERLLQPKTTPFILDVREPSEYQSGHIKGAMLIPLGTLPDHLAELPKDKPIVVICRSGNRSARATEFLLQNGFTNVENMTGGMIAWDAQCKAGGKVC